jgi:hypothetical protein
MEVFPMPIRKKVSPPAMAGDVPRHDLGNAWVKSTQPPRTCLEVTRETLSANVIYSCIKSCGEKSFFWIVKKNAESRNGYVVLADSRSSPTDLIELDLEPLSVAMIKYNEAGFQWFDKTVLKYFREALRCDSNLQRLSETDFLTDNSPDFSRTCPGTKPERSSKSIIQPADKADSKAIVRPFPRIQFSDSRGYEIEASSTNKMNLPRLANDLVIRRLSRCPL